MQNYTENPDFHLNAGQSVPNPPLSNELRILKASLRRANAAMRNNPDNPEKAGLLLARLANAIARLTIAQQKLSSTSPSTIEAEFDNTLRSMGLGEQE